MRPSGDVDLCVPEGDVAAAAAKLSGPLPCTVDLHAGVPDLPDRRWCEVLGRSRRIIATVLSQKGVPLQTLTVGHYTAPGPFRPGRPHGLRIVRARASALVSWKPVAGARSRR